MKITKEVKGSGLITVELIRIFLYDTLKYSITDEELLKKCIDELIRQEFVSKKSVDWKTYFKFSHPEYKKRIKERYNYLIFKATHLNN